ncbi:c-type cytochrome [Zoogloea oleivorans]|uniref:C-type cytochrome n=1 Tax=Zoogloea oleivorans TaxID=1552750 RepID=A0A6C2CL73_9RHOO|nr:c-type cytochrome [Zoogloea oleivorans]TYC55070.1 c-type cytochrome [Zoogloea oleivorans]
MAARLLTCAFALFATTSPLHAVEVADPNVKVDTSGLATLSGNPASNPYRGNARAADIGRTAFNQACARCHGIDAVNKGQVGPDLTKMDRACRRITDPAVQRLCVEDNDDFFLKSVQQGKVRVGVVHMPAWQDVLSPAAIWTLRTFLETRRGQ